MIRHVRLELARCHEFPEGSNAHGYELSLPLTEAGHLDHDAWSKHPRDFHFSRFWGDEEARGRLHHNRRGWALAVGPDDEVIFKGDDHRFAAGDYVSINENDGVTRTFRVVEVR
jgi:hypothetical protein